MFLSYVFFNVMPIQGFLLGIEWDWEYKWFTINLGIIKFFCDYSSPSDEW